MIWKKMQIIGLVLFAFMLFSCEDNGENGENGENPSRNNEWIKFPFNPVLPSGPPDAWNNYKSDPCVLKDGDLYKMWYSTDQDGTRAKITYTESYDGVNWEEALAPVLEPSSLDSWDGRHAETPTVIIDLDAPSHEKYKMWYTGMPIEEEVYRIGYATSPDGITWTKYENNPVLDIGDKSIYEWDGWAVADPMVVKINSLYMMWYSGAALDPSGKPIYYIRIGLATSNDGVNWFKWPENPVLDIGPPDSFESKGVASPSVYFNEELQIYEMWYSGWSNLGLVDPPISDIGYAYSPGGFEWAKLEFNPILTRGGLGEWDADMVLAPTVIYDEDMYKMWFTNQVVDITTYEIKMGIGYAIKGD